MASDNKRIAHQVFPVRGPLPGKVNIAPVQQSGQKQCYNPTGIKYPADEPWRYPDYPLNQIACSPDPDKAGIPYYDPQGQDGLLRPGYAWDAATRFTDNGNGTVTDNLTGLIWTKHAHWNVAIGGAPWLQAMEMVQNIGSGTTEGFKSQ